MKIKYPLLLLLSLTLFSQLILAQSPWTKEKEKAYVQLSTSAIFYNKAAIDGEKVNLPADFSDITTQIYAEYGISNNLEAQLILPYKFATSKTNDKDGTESLNGIGNITIGLKYKIYNAAWKVSTGLQYIANSIKTKPNGLTTGFDSTTFIPYVTAGTSMGKWYYFGNLGYGYMTNDYSDFLKLDAEVGYAIIENGYLIFALNTKNVVSKENAFDNNGELWPSYLDRQAYNAFGIKFNYEFSKDKLGANFAFFGAFGNDNIPLAPSLNLGIYAKL